MAIHTFTTEQMRKFVEAVGGDREPEVTEGQFTTDKLVELTQSIGGLSDWPNITDDPRVNFAVDCVVCLGMDDEEEPTYDERIYTDEVEAYREIGSFA